MTSLQAAEVVGLQDVLALVEGSSRTGKPGLAPDVRGWLASPEQGLTATVEPVRGAEATAEALGRLAPSGLTVLATVHADHACWAEIVRHGHDHGHGVGDPETCVIGLSYGLSGAVSRLIWLRAPLVPGLGADATATVPRSEADTPEAAPAGRPILERYFADLMSSRFNEAASHFTVNTLYSHPPYAGGTERVLFEGRDALRRGFAELRGPSPARQIVTDFWQQGKRMFVEGVIEGIPNGGTFFSTGHISPDGEIARYVAFYSGARIPASTAWTAGPPAAHQKPVLPNLN